MNRIGRAAAFAAGAALMITLPADHALADREDWTQAEALGARLVEAVNTPALREEAVRAVFAEATLAERGQARLMTLLEKLAADYGPMELHHAEVSTFRMGETARHHLHVFIRSGKDGKWKDLQLRLEDVPPYRVTALAFIADVAEPVHLPAGSLPDPYVVGWLNEYVEELVKEEDLSGALLVAAGDRVVVERYFGFADSARAIPCTAGTRFNLGSGNKMFTALAAAMLVEEGKLSFDTTLDRFFPDFPDQAWVKKATVGHLLSHTSGLAEYWTKDTAEKVRQVVNVRDLLPLVEAAGIDFAPGEGAVYSNSNFILAGLILEKITGQDYHDLVRSRIFAPCGMTDTDAHRQDGAAPNLAVALAGKPNGWKPAPRGSRGTSAGGGFSTTHDILRFGRRLVTGKVVSPAMLAEMTRSHTAHVPGATLDYGYGFLRERGGGSESYGHGGIASGVNFEYRYFPANDMTLIAFSNQDNGAYDSLRKTATKLITGER